MSVGEEGNALVLEQCALRLGSTEGEALRQAPICKYDSVTRYVPGFGIDMQRVSHVSRSPRLVYEFGDLPVCGYHAAGHLAHHVVHAIEKPVC